MTELSKEEIKEIGQTVRLKVGEKIRQIREQKGLTQTQLATCILSDRQYMYRIESGKIGISIVKLAVIAKALDIQVSNLLEIDI